jgi:transposase
MLEDANIKLVSVASDIFGISGQRMLNYLLDCESINPEQVADLAIGKLREKQEVPKLAAEGRMTKHHRMMIRLSMKHINDLDSLISQVNSAIDELLKLYSVQISLLIQIPGMNHQIAAVVIAEIGVDMTVFPTEKHLSPWAGLCPGSNESVGKRKSGKTRPGNRLLRENLTEAAWAASHTKNTFLRHKCWQLRNRRGDKRALAAITHKILAYEYHMLKDMQPYRELGPDYLDKSKENQAISRMVRTLMAKGYNVTPVENPVVVV